MTMQHLHIVLQEVGISQKCFCFCFFLFGFFYATSWKKNKTKTLEFPMFKFINLPSIPRTVKSLLVVNTEPSRGPVCIND